MLVLLGSVDKFLGLSIGDIVAKADHKLIRTSKVDRILDELKRKDRCAIIDMAWEEAQRPGVLKQFVNLSRIAGNKVICLCPNQDEDLKKMAAMSRPDQVFIRYDLLTSFTDYLQHEVKS